MKSKRLSDMENLPWLTKVDVMMFCIVGILLVTFGVFYVGYKLCKRWKR
jgi:hypothetical protein